MLRVVPWFPDSADQADFPVTREFYCRGADASADFFTLLSLVAPFALSTSA